MRISVFCGYLTAAAAALLLLASGCGKGGRSAKILVGVSIPSADHGWTGGVVWHAQRAKERIESANPDVKVLISTAGDAAEQVDKVENLLARGISALVILPHEPGPLTGVCERVKSGGVKLVVVDRGLTRDIQDLSVAGDNAGFGRAGAETLVKFLGGKGKILIMEGIPCTVNSERVDAFREVIRRYPGITVLDSQSAYWDTEKGLKLMENYLQKHPHIDAVWTGDDDVLLGALKAYEESGRKDIRCFIGGAGAKQVVKMVMDGHPLIPFDVTYPPEMVAVGIERALELAEGKAANGQRRVIVPSQVIDRENAGKFYFPDSVF